MTKAPFVPDAVGSVAPTRIAEQRARAGVSHFVTTDRETQEELAASGRFQLVWSDTPLAIFAVVGMDEQPEAEALLTAPDTSLDARVAAASAENVEIEFEAEHRALAEVAIAWSPKWHATIDGRDVTLVRGTDGFMQLEIPGGEHRLVLAYEPDGWDRVGLAFSLATAVALAVFAFSRRRRRADASNASG